MCTTFNKKPCSTIVSCSSFTNASEKMDITTFYDGQSSFARHIPKYNVLSIGGDMNA